LLDDTINFNNFNKYCIVNERILACLSIF